MIEHLNETGELRQRLKPFQVWLAGLEVSSFSFIVPGPGGGGADLQ